MISAGSPRYRYELLIPLYDNERNPVDYAEVVRVGEQLTKRFKGFRVQPTAPYSGEWCHEATLYNDLTLLFIIDGPPEVSDVEWFQAYKEELKVTFRQRGIYLAAHEIVWL